MINVEERSSLGGAAVRRIRKAGKLPGVVYSDSHPSWALEIDDHQYHMAVKGCNATQIFKFKSSNPKLDGLTTLIKQVQVEPVKGRVLHVDFISLSKGHRITITVPLRLTGESAAVKENRAFINQQAYEIDVESLPDEIPSELVLDISSIKEGETMHASDVILPKGVTLKSIPGLSVVSALSKKAMEAAELAAEAASAQAPVAPVAGTEAEKDKDKSKEK